MGFLQRLHQPAVIVFMRKAFQIAALGFIAMTIVSCLLETPANQYDLMMSVNEGKFPSSELDNMAYIVREAVEKNNRWNTEWLTYWVNAEWQAMCGKLSVRDQQEGQTDTPLNPIELQEIERVEVWIEFHSLTESQFLDNSPDFPVAKTVQATVVYRDNRWEVQSVKELEESLSVYCP